MRTLQNHLILYDAECPMCQLYTRAFTRSGMLDPDGRAPYQEISAAACPLVDLNRAVNEIALIDTKTGEVKYGIESLFKVIGHSFPRLRPLFSWRPFLWTMRKTYAFISYNRKVIIPPPAFAPTTAEGPAPQPAFRLPHRLAWLLFTVLIAAAILTSYTRQTLGLPWQHDDRLARRFARPRARARHRRLHPSATHLRHRLVPDRRRPYATRTYPPYQIARPRLDPHHQLDRLPPACLNPHPDLNPTHN
jgi:hypothetical protein